jgi:hypothetical protein
MVVLCSTLSRFFSLRPSGAQRARVSGMRKSTRASGAAGGGGGGGENELLQARCPAPRARRPRAHILLRHATTVLR